MNNLFEEIDKLKIELPKVKTIQKEVGQQTLNFYQVTAIVAFIVCFIIGILLGNLFPTCTATSGLYSTFCTQKTFNLSLTVFVWAVSFVGMVFFYAIGHIIQLLTSINENLSNTK